MRQKVITFIQLMRLPFVTASVIPFCIGAGYVFSIDGFNIFNIRLFFCLCAVVFGHIGANIFNDYYDSRSGNDWQDMRAHIYFGGSKIIQHGLMSERSVFIIAASFTVLAALCVAALQMMIPHMPIILFGIAILVLAVLYSAPPLKLVYRGWGELVIFILFGPAIVAGTCSVLTMKYWSLREILLSLPISFLVTAILYVNEVPDYAVDKKAFKKNLVVRIGPARAWIGYVFLVSGAFISIIMCVAMKILPAGSLIVLLFFFVYAKAVSILKSDYSSLERLKVASRRTIAGHALVGVGLVATLVFSRLDCFVVPPSAGLFAMTDETSLEEYSQTKEYFGAYVKIRCFFDEKQGVAPVIDRCWQRMDELQTRMNAYSETSEVAAINRGGAEGVVVDKDMYLLLEETIALSQKTEGAFDVTIFPLVRLWKDAARQGRNPTEEELKSARDLVDYRNIRLMAPDRIRLSKDGMKIDLGGVVSGYACDELDRILTSGGIKDFMVDTGGEILCRGYDRGRKPWRIGVQNPLDKNAVMETVSVKDRCISTSGSYEKYLKVRNEKYSHIIDPRTGLPEKNVISATVIAPTGIQADALSTALCVMGSEKGLAVVRTMNDVEAMCVEKRPDGTVARSQTERFGKQ